MKITRRTEQEINISELKAAIKEGRGLEVIRPHDEITLTMDTGETITPVCGYVGKHSARFIFKDCLREMWQMNKTMTNKGGYFRSEARRHVLEDICPQNCAKRSRRDTYARKSTAKRTNILIRCGCRRQRMFSAMTRMDGGRKKQTASSCLFSRRNATA